MTIENLQETLEMAAKAAGMQGWAWDGSLGALAKTIDDEAIGLYTEAWEPHLNLCYAAELAIAAKVGVHIIGDMVGAYPSPDVWTHWVPYQGGKKERAEAYCQAVTIAAAKAGRAMR